MTALTLVKRPALIPTEEQSRIISEALHSQDSLIISALAGAAKTSSLEMVASALSTTPILYIVFNKRNSDEAKQRLPSNVKVSTINAVGHGVWATAVAKKLTIDTKKSYNILKSIIDAFPKARKGQAYADFSDTLKMIGAAKLRGYIPDHAFQDTPRLCSSTEFYGSLEEEPEEIQMELVDQALVESIRQSFNGLIDFDDQLYMSCLFASGGFPKFPLVLLDETQDMSPLNLAMIEKLVTKRLIAVGDKFQCQPAGTMVRTPNGDVPIETIKPGDSVIALHRDKEYLRARKVLDVAMRQYNGELIRVSAGNKQYDATPNHKCLVKVSEDKSDWHCVYLMRRGSNFRVGKTALRRTTPNKYFGPSMRARQEHADAIWILQAFPTKEDALMYEQLIAAEFGIPTFCFYNSGETALPQGRLDQMWDIIGNNMDKAIKALKSFKRELEFPLWTPNSGGQIGFDRQFLIRACNLDHEMFDVPVTTIGYIKWQKASISRTWYTGIVHSLEVEATDSTTNNGLYISNGIVTGNSIYAFRGADGQAMEKLRIKYSMKPLDLSVSFRCSQRVVERARFRAPTMQWRPGAPLGTVEVLGTWTSSSIPDGAAIICRTNAPLFKCALQLIRAGRGVKLIGSDLGPQLVKSLKKLGPESMTQEETLRAIDKWEAERLRKSRAKASTSDKAACLRVFCEYGETLSAIIAYAEMLFATEGPIQLSTIHKAKGLEWSVVYFLNRGSIPSKWAITPEDLEQEQNCIYVGITRAKSELYFVDLANLTSDEEIDAGDLN